VSDFTNQEPFVVTAEDLKRPWSGYRDGRKFGCGICLSRFEEGQTVRWILMRGAPNLFVCAACDTPDIKEKWVDRWHNVIVPILKRWGHDYD
jgi:hypothetical protein